MIFFAATRTRTNAFPCNPKCGNSAAFFALQRNQTGQYSRRRYSRRQSKTHTRPHMDDHPSLPGKEFQTLTSSRFLGISLESKCRNRV